MYIDIITNYKIPAFFIFLTGKQQLLYEEIFKSAKNLIKVKGKYQINIDSITTDPDVRITAPRTSGSEDQEDSPQDVPDTSKN